MSFPNNPINNQRYNNYTYDGEAKVWRLSKVYQEQLDFGTEENQINANDIPLLGESDNVQESITNSAIKFALVLG